MVADAEPRELPPHRLLPRHFLFIPAGAGASARNEILGVCFSLSQLKVVLRHDSGEFFQVG